MEKINKLFHDIKIPDSEIKGQPAQRSFQELNSTGTLLRFNYLLFNVLDVN